MTDLSASGPAAGSGPVLVTGATGTTGRHLTQLLRERGTLVREAGRHAQPGTRVWFDWGDPASYPAAVDGISGIYLLRPPRAADAMPLVERSSTFAVDTLTGRLLWQTRNIGVSGTAAEEGIAYLAGISAQALDARSGRQLWTRSYASPAAFVAAASGVVYLDCYPHLVAASAATGAQLWSYSQGTANSNLFTMAAGNGVVYVANSGQASGTVDAVRM